MVEALAEEMKYDVELQRLLDIFPQQRRAYRAEPMPSAKQRKDKLRRLERALIENRQQLIDAVSSDFSCRSADETLLAEIMTTSQSIQYMIKHVGGWMKTSRRHVSALFALANNRVEYQPLGVVGIMVPWNYPIQLAIVPLATALAAGNRAMIKMSEFTPATNRAVKAILAGLFEEDEVAIIEGEVEVSSAFSEQPWDHLVFTGSTAVGKHVMAAASKNLVPVTLELGGKSPAIVGDDMPLKEAAQRLCFGKSFNAGQTCVAPDYVLVPEGQQKAFVEEYRAAFSQMYPTLRDNSDYSAIINDRQHERLLAWVEDAREKGAQVSTINPANEDFSGTRKMPPVLIEGGTESMKVMQEELFGPILPVVGYKDLDSAIEYVNDRDRPLALYVFSYNKSTERKVLDNTHAGGVCVNDTLAHLAQDDMPFGGIGPSGMGQYHGKEGFLALSKAKSVHKRGRIHSGKVIYPPYDKGLNRLIYKLFIK